MNYRGTIAYRSGIGRQIDEGFAASFIAAWDFLVRNFHDPDVSVGMPGTVVGLGNASFNFMRGLSCMPHDAANQIAQGFQGDWVLFLDTDHIFRSDAFFELITTFEENQLDILVGFTQKRQQPYTPVIFRTDFDPYYDFETIVPDAIQRQMLVPIDSSGLACTLVHRRVFEKIHQFLGELPFDFRPKFHPPHGARPFESKIWTGYDNRDRVLPKGRRSDEFYWEDTSFFWRAALCGFRAFCAPWVKFHHLEQRAVTDDLIQKVTQKSMGVLERNPGL